MDPSVEKKRCPWCLGDQRYIDYHDYEWGRPVHDDRHLFEMLCLEGAQAGLSWLTILQKREHYRIVFDNFYPEKIARYNDEKVEALLSDRGIVRNKLKVRAFITNARAFLAVRDQYGSFDRFIWQFTGHQTIHNPIEKMEDYQSTSPESQLMSKGLKKHGFKFVGPTICYAYMQSVGMVNDHLLDCFIRKEIEAA